MKKLSLVILLCFGIQLISAQNFRKPYREAKRALNKKDYVNATLKSIESLKAKKNFKKSNDILGYLQFNLTKSVLLQTKTGYTIGRSYKVYDDNDKTDFRN